MSASVHSSPSLFLTLHFQFFCHFLVSFPKIHFKEVHTAGCKKKERRKKAGRILFALHENILNGKKIISIAVNAFFQLNEYTLLPIFWDLTMERCIGVSHDILEIVIGLDGWI